MLATRAGSIASRIVPINLVVSSSVTMCGDVDTISDYYEFLITPSSLRCLLTSFRELIGKAQRPFCRHTYEQLPHPCHCITLNLLRLASCLVEICEHRNELDGHP